MRRDSASAAAKAAVATLEDIEGARTILSVTIENWKRLTFCRYKLNPTGLTILGGMNGHGKSSNIDGVIAALGGGRQVPPKPVREGEDEARVTLEFPGFLLKMVVQPDRQGKWIVTRPDGTVIDRARDFLDSLIGPIAFDPVAFMRMPTKEQAETLIRLVGLDLSTIDTALAKTFEQRTAVGQDLKRANGHAESLPFHEHAPSVAVDVAELGAMLQGKHRHNQNIAAACAEHERLVERRSQVQAQAKELQRQLAALKEQYESLGEHLKAKADAIAALGEPEDTASVMDQLEQAEGINSQVRANEERRKALAEAAQIKREHDALTEAIEGYRAERKRLLSECKFPVDGLTVDEDGNVLYRGLPMEQASGGERLRVSTAISMAMSGGLKLAFIRDGSLLDLDNLAIVDDEVRKAEGQVMMERVGHGDEAHVIIEDGVARPVERNGKAEVAA